MHLEYAEEYSRELCRAHPAKLFVFGDNVQRRGLGGQACIRGERNAHGVRTKLRPSMAPGSFFSDEHYDDNIELINEDFSRLIRWHGTIVLPAAGLGTGRAELEYWAPKTYRFLESRIEVLRLTAQSQT